MRAHASVLLAVAASICFAAGGETSASGAFLPARTTTTTTRAVLKLGSNEHAWTDMNCVVDQKIITYQSPLMAHHDGTYNAGSWQANLVNQFSCWNTNTEENLGAYVKAGPKVNGKEALLTFGHPIESSGGCGECWALAFKDGKGGCQYATIKAVETWTWSMEMGTTEHNKLRASGACLDAGRCKDGDKLPFKYYKMPDCTSDVTIDVGDDCSTHGNHMQYDGASTPSVYCNPI